MNIALFAHLVKCTKVTIEGNTIIVTYETKVESWC